MSSSSTERDKSDTPNDADRDLRTAARTAESPSTSISSGIELITSFIQDKLKLTSAVTEDHDRTPHPNNVLAEPTVDAVAAYIRSGKCKRIITMVGAGISTAAGIPDFRSPGSGVYSNLSKFNLTHPECVFSLDYFSHNPRPFFALAKELYPGSFKPTASHYFVRLLEEKKLLQRHFTQNIDTLERAAGISHEKLVEAHGTFHTGHCLKCKEAYTLEWMKERIFRDEIPTCTACDEGVVKPDIVFFGENLPARFFKCLNDFRHCDLLIIMGSSLVVHPFADLVDRVASCTPRLLINNEKCGETMRFDRDDNVRDVLMLGDCDEQCQLLAEKLGWADDLKKLIARESAKVDPPSKQRVAESATGRRKCSK